MTGLVETVERLIDPHAFKCWQASYEYCINTGDAPEVAKDSADRWHGSDIASARERAQAVIPIILAEAAKVARECDMFNHREQLLNSDPRETIATAIEGLAE